MDGVGRGGVDGGGVDRGARPFPAFGGGATPGGRLDPPTTALFMAPFMAALTTMASWANRLAPLTPVNAKAHPAVLPAVLSARILATSASRADPVPATASAMVNGP